LSGNDGPFAVVEKRGMMQRSKPQVVWPFPFPLLCDAACVAVPEDGKGRPHVARAKKWSLEPNLSQGILTAVVQQLQALFHPPLLRCDWN
jgi:hypothetical protein